MDDIDGPVESSEEGTRFRLWGLDRAGGEESADAFLVAPYSLAGRDGRAAK